MFGSSSQRVELSLNRNGQPVPLHVDEERPAVVPRARPCELAPAAGVAREGLHFAGTVKNPKELFTAAAFGKDEIPPRHHAKTVGHIQV
jgi:hypothetical protein